MSTILIWSVSIFPEEETLYISKNKDTLERELVNLSYVKLNPQILTQSNEYNNLYFQTIDEIENLIFEGASIDKIKNAYNLKLININNFYLKNDEKEESLIEIYSNRNSHKTNLIDKDEYFLLYEIKKIKDNQFRLLVGPFKNFNTLKSAYISLNNLGFESMNIYQE